MSHDPSGGVLITQQGPSPAARRRPASLHSSVVELHRLLRASTAACPPIPQPLSARHKAAKSTPKGR